MAKSFVCPDCNEIVRSPAVESGMLRCRRGHRVQQLGSVWAETAKTALVALAAAGLIIGAGAALTGTAAAAAALALLLCGGWALFLLVKGTQFRRSTGVKRKLGTQYLGAASGALFLSLFLVLGIAAGVFR